MEVKEAFITMFGFDLLNFDEAYLNSCIRGCMFDSLKEARKMKSAYEYFKERFNWKENFSIYKYPSGKYSVENASGYACTFKAYDIEKIE